MFSDADGACVFATPCSSPMKSAYATPVAMPRVLVCPPAPSRPCRARPANSAPYFAPSCRGYQNTQGSQGSQAYQYTPVEYMVLQLHGLMSMAGVSPRVIKVRVFIFAALCMTAKDDE